VTLSATDAELHGSQLQLEEKGGRPDIGFSVQLIPAD
jgi:hypothetical protein